MHALLCERLCDLFTDTCIATYEDYEWIEGTLVMFSAPVTMPTWPWRDGNAKAFAGRHNWSQIPSWKKNQRLRMVVMKESMPPKPVKMIQKMLLRYWNTNMLQVQRMGEGGEKKKKLECHVIDFTCNLWSNNGYMNRYYYGTCMGGAIVNHKWSSRLCPELTHAMQHNFTNMWKVFLLVVIHKSSSSVVQL